MTNLAPSFERAAKVMLVAICRIFAGIFVRSFAHATTLCNKFLFYFIVNLFYYKWCATGKCAGKLEITPSRLAGVATFE